MKTKLQYMTNSHIKESQANVISISKNGKHAEVILDSTIFYPQGGGQPSDKGEIIGKNGLLKISFISYNNGNPIHQGKLQGTIEENEKVELKIDWPHRIKNMQSHTSGHILDEAAKEIFPEYPGVEGAHGIGKKYFIKFKGIADNTFKDSLQKKIDEIIRNDEPINTRMVTAKQIEEENIHIPFKLPENKPLRLIEIGEREPTPDGGTQLKSTGESWPITINDEFEYEDGHTIIHYQVKQSKTIKENSASINLEDFSKLKEQILIQTKEKWSESSHAKYLGRNGLFNKNIASNIRLVNKTDRPKAGKIANEVKTKLEELWEEYLTSKDERKTEWLDITAPGKTPPTTSLHPISQAIEEITHIFEGIGFTRVRYPEVDFDKYVFEGLNMPSDHPARDEWETFFVDVPKNPKMGEVVLTTHTSNGQVREMERVGEPPIRMLNLGKCYRRQQDVTHTAMFHQFEGLVIDEGINIQHLKGTLDYFARKFYGPTAKSRIRPFMFKFTEPSFEVDFSCTHCEGTGMQGKEKCRFCKSGWHEVGGSGMVHPNVLKAGGIDPEKYSGFAFGWGVERVYTLKPGLELDDIRPLYSNDLKFLNQF